MAFSQKYGAPSPRPTTVGIGRTLRSKCENVCRINYSVSDLHLFEAEVAERGFQEGDKVLESVLRDREGEMIKRHDDGRSVVG
jgi:hypothetical protein